MTTWSGQTTATMDNDINFSFPFHLDETEEPDISKTFQQNAGIGAEFGTITDIRIPELAAQNTSGSLELNFGEESESGVTQEFAGIQPQVPAFSFYSEEDILNLDAVIDTPPPRLSRTIRVKLIYEEPSEPIPVEDPWE